VTTWLRAAVREKVGPEVPEEEYVDEVEVVDEVEEPGESVDEPETEHVDEPEKVNARRRSRPEKAITGKYAGHTPHKVRGTLRPHPVVIGCGRSVMTTDRARDYGQRDGPTWHHRQGTSARSLSRLLHRDHRGSLRAGVRHRDHQAVPKLGIDLKGGTASC